MRVDFGARELRGLIGTAVTLILLASSAQVAHAADGESRPSESRSSEARSSAPRRIVAELAISTSATMLLAPAIYSGARFVGTATPNAATSIIPALLLALTLPPAVAAASVTYQRRRDGERSGFFPTYFYALGAQAIVLAG